MHNQVRSPALSTRVLLAAIVVVAAVGLITTERSRGGRQRAE